MTDTHDIKLLLKKQGQGQWQWQWPCGLMQEMFAPSLTSETFARMPFEAWMYVCVLSMFVLSCLLGGLATTSSPVQGVIPAICKIHYIRLILNGNRPECLSRRRKKERKLIINRFHNLDQAHAAQDGEQDRKSADLPAP